MASDSRGEGAVPVELPAELEAWLDEHAAERDVDREEVLVQLLASYRAANELDVDPETGSILDEDVTAALDADEVIEDALDSRGSDLLEGPVAKAVERALADRLADEVEVAVEEHLPTVTDAVEERLEERTIDDVEGRLEAIEAEFQEKIVDVRERVIQVKTETDAKAPADHDHDAFERVDAIDERLRDLAETVDDVEATVDDLDGTVEALRKDVDEKLGDADDADDEKLGDAGDAGDADDANGGVGDDLVERLADAEDKLRRVAWVVSDLKDQTGGRSAREQSVDRIKRAAAQEGVRSADCERCGEAVDVALLTDPECPHCNAAVADVRPTGGIFRTKATLVAAAQLESGEE